ncbi:hypothetical protein EDD17DRAFT_394072 [Pisolithus thermaeus]|nr:hypothetical protein EDD17DRAFT_394072 [Pisolithus thermaeus]
MTCTDMAIAWSGQMAFDAIVFVLTLWRTLRVGRSGNRTLLDVLIRDGVLYFGLMTGANVANITAFLSFTGRQSSAKSLVAGFTNVISSIMISRLMLDLHDLGVLVSSRPTTSYDTSLLTTVVEAERVWECAHTSRRCYHVGGCVGYRDGGGELERDYHNANEPPHANRLRIEM